VATPGRLLDLHRQNAVKFSQLETLVLDEADRMLDLGFARELDAVFAALPKQRQTLLFSATFSDAIREMAGRLLNKPVSVEATPRNTAAKGVKQWMVPVDKKRKTELFLHLLKKKRWKQVLVFVKTKKGADELANALSAQGIPADAIHGDRCRGARSKETKKAEEAQGARLRQRAQSTKSLVDFRHSLDCCS
jgi:ATP-dependent RNA helicase RhlE